jgi:hypothetical protein
MNMNIMYVIVVVVSNQLQEVLLYCSSVTIYTTTTNLYVMKQICNIYVHTVEIQNIYVM